MKEWKDKRLTISYRDLVCIAHLIRGGKEVFIMRALKNLDRGTIIFTLGAVGAICLLDWGKEVVKAFVTGGVIASWLTMKLTR